MNENLTFTLETQGVSSFEVYKMSDNDVFDTMNFGMMTNNNIPNILPMIFTQTDSERYFKFNVSSKTSLKSFLQGVVNKKRLLTVLSGICNAYANAEDYMLSANAFILDPDYIFVNVSTAEASLICLPIIMDSKMPDLKKFFKNLIFNIRTDATENNDYIGKILTYINSPEIFSVERFSVLINSLLAGGTGVLNEKPVLNQANNVGRQPVQTPVQPQVVSQPVQSVQQPVQPVQPVQQPAVQQPVQQPVQAQKNPIPQTPPRPVTQPKQPLSNSGMKQNLQPPIPKKAPATPIAPVTQEDNKKKKGGFLSGLFRGKEKSKAPKAPMSKVASQGNSNFAVPGQKTPPTMINRQPPQPMAGQPVPQQPQTLDQQLKPNMPQQAQAPVYSPVQQVPLEEKRSVNMQSLGGFGETTFLDENVSEAGETTVLSQNSVSRQPYIIRKKDNSKVIITSDVFKIGKERSYNDYFIGDNPAISRNHAVISKTNGEYFINDSSSNGTFINGQRIPRGQLTKISSGVRITLADEDFDFYTY